MVSCSLFSTVRRMATLWKRSNPRILVHETLVDILPLHEFGKYSSFAAYDGPDPVDLGGLLRVDQNLISTFHLAADILFEEVKVLVKPGLRGDVEFFRIRLLLSYRHLEEYPAESCRAGEEISFLINVGGIQPDGAGRGNDIQKDVSLVGGVGQDASYNIYTFLVFLRNLGITVEYADAFYLVSPEGNAVWKVVGIGENIYQGAPDGVLAGGGNEIRTLESLAVQGRNDGVETYFLALGQGEEVFSFAAGGGNSFFQGVRAAYYKYLFSFIFEYGADGRRALDADG